MFRFGVKKLITAIAESKDDSVYACLKERFSIDNRIYDSTPGVTKEFVPGEVDSTQTLGLVTGTFTIEDGVVGGGPYAIDYATGAGTEETAGLPQLGTDDFIILINANTVSTVGSITLGSAGLAQIVLKADAAVVQRITGNNITFGSIATGVPYQMIAVAVSPTNNTATLYILDAINDTLYTDTGVVTGSINGAFNLGNTFSTLNLFKWRHITFLSFANGLPGDVPAGVTWMGNNPDAGIYPAWEIYT